MGKKKTWRAPARASASTTILYTCTRDARKEDVARARVGPVHKKHAKELGGECKKKDVARARRVGPVHNFFCYEEKILF